MKLATAQRLALKVVSELLPFCEKIEIAGSIRRERPDVRDIDIVLIPQPGATEKILARCSKKMERFSGGRRQDPNNVSFCHKTEPFSLDLFFAHGEIVDLVNTTPSNWGAVYLCRTGSVEHNVQLCSLAHAKGLKFAPYRGIIAAGSDDCEGHKSGDIIAGATEEEIYAALGLEWREPREREELK